MVNERTRLQGLQLNSADGDCQSGRSRVRDTDAQERLARERGYFERILLDRMGTTLSVEDVEDIVSEALIDSAPHCPVDAANGGRAWFTRVALNRAEDYRRARDGRPRSARGPGRGPNVPTVSRRFVSIDDVHAAPGDSAVLVVDESSAFAEIDEEADRRAASELVERALASLPPEQAALLRVRHLAEDRLTRAQIAERLGLSISQYESRHSTAWRALVAAARAVRGGATVEPAQRAKHGCGGAPTAAGKLGRVRRPADLPLAA